MRFKEHYFVEANESLDKKYEHRQNFTKDSLFNRPKRLDILLDLLSKGSKFIVRKKNEPVKEVVFPFNKNKKIFQILKDKDIATLDSMPIHFVDSNGETYNLKDLVKSEMIVARGLSKGGSYETIFCNAWNKKHGFPVKTPNDLDDTIGKNLVEFVSKTIKKKEEAFNLGSDKRYTISNDWKMLLNSNREPDKTPKTDIKIDGYRISAKMADPGGKVRICSAQVIQGEGQGLLYNALNKSGVQQKVINEIDKWINPSENLLGKNIRSDDIRKQISINHEEFQKFLSETFAHDLKFKTAFIEEATTGEIKFVEEPPKANYFLKFDEEATKIEFVPIADKIKKLAPQLKIGVVWKTGGSGSSTVFSVKEEPVKVKKENIEIDKLFDYAESLGVNLNDNLLNENIISKAVEIGKNFGENIADLFKKVLNAVVGIIKKGIGYFLKFFGIEADVTEINDFDF